MIISNPIKTRKIELSKIASVDQDFPSHQIEIKMETEFVKTTIVNFTWISDQEIDEFLEALYHLEKSGKGHAELKSNSSGEFSLFLASTNKPKQIVVILKFAKHDPKGKAYTYKLGVEFQTDADMLQQVIEDVKRLKI